MAKKVIGGKYSKYKQFFDKYEYEANGERINGIKVIVPKDDHGSLPTMSQTPSTTYILKKKGNYISIGIYGYDRRLIKSIDIAHLHRSKTNAGKKIEFPKGVAHVHNYRGGRGNNVRLLTKAEIAKYGDTIIKMGGKLK